MKRLLNITLTASMAVLFATGCSSSDGSSTSDTTPPPTVTPPPTLPNLSGRLVDGYLEGAFVFADCNGNNAHDSDPTAADMVEPSSITDGAGNFALTVPDTCPNATLIASGGTNIDTGLPFSGVLMAPAGSENITPLTTLVAIDPTFAAKIEDYNISVDTDFAEAGVAIPADLLVISQQVVTAINVVSFNTKTADISDTIASIVTPLVSSLANTDLTDSNATSTQLTASAVSSFEAIAAANDDITLDANASAQIDASLTTTMDTIVTEIESQIDATGSVSLSDVDVTAIADEVVANNEAIKAVVALPIATVNSFIINTTAMTSTGATTFDATTTEADVKTSIVADTNMSDASDNSYNVNLSVVINDVNSLRSATFVINNINMSTAQGSALVSIVDTAYSATVTGTDGLGNAFAPVVLSGASIQDILTSTPQTNSSHVNINMNELFGSVTTQAGASHPLGDFLVSGSYDMIVNIAGLPTEFTSYTLHMTIN